MARQPNVSLGRNFRKFFLRGLAIVLPTVLTIWILLAAYNFVQGKIARPINTGVKNLVLVLTDWPAASRQEVFELARQEGKQVLVPSERRALERQIRREKINAVWAQNSFVLDLIGLVVAILAIYMAGAFLGNVIGRRLYARGEAFLRRLPLFKQVYPYVKQVTDFVLGEDPDSKMQFNRVVAVQYPRKGIWSVGLVTGGTMRVIEDKAGEECVTLFIPSSPTPFTGYVITVPRSDTIDLPITIDDAVRFTVSGGVIVPEAQAIKVREAIGAATAEAEEGALEEAETASGRQLSV